MTQPIYDEAEEHEEEEEDDEPELSDSELEDEEALTASWASCCALAGSDVATKEAPQGMVALFA